MAFGINVDFAVRRGGTHEGSFQEMLGITGITAEPNPGGFLSTEAVHRSLRLLTEKVMPAFK